MLLVRFMVLAVYFEEPKTQLLSFGKFMMKAGVHSKA